MSRIRSNSRYKGGFVRVNGRTNNSVAYNHDYYESNKDKWKKVYEQNQKKKKYGKIADWLGFDERDAMNKAIKDVRDQREYEKYLQDPFNYVWDFSNGHIYDNGVNEDAVYNFNNDTVFDDMTAAREERRRLEREATKTINKYYDTPIGKIQGAYEDAKFEVEYFFEYTIPDLFKRRK